MKKIMIALAMVGITCAGAEAQTKVKYVCKPVKYKKHVAKRTVRPANHMSTASFGKTYQVCRDEGGYNTCCIYNTASTARKSW